MSKEMPTCKKCGKLHWYFKSCEEGITRKRVGYDTLQQESDYSPPRRNTTGYQSILGKTSYKQTHQTNRVHYQEEER